MPDGGTKWRSRDEFVLDVSEHYFVEIGEMWHENRPDDAIDQKVLMALFRDKRNPFGSGVTQKRPRETSKASASCCAGCGRMGSSFAARGRVSADASRSSAPARVPST